MNVRNTIAAALALACAAGLTSLQARAGDSTLSGQGQHEAGMRVYVDPETGQLSPVPVTAEQVVEDELFQASKSVAPMEEIRSADGTVTVRLNGNFEVASKVVIAPDGRRISLCAMADHAGDVAHVHLTPATQPEER